MANKTDSALKELEKKLESIMKDIREFKQSMSFLNQNLEENRKEMKELLETQKEILKDNKKLKGENSTLRSEYKILRSNFEFIERQKIVCFLELAGIPERSNENLLDIVINIARVAGYDLSKDKVVSVKRMVKKKKSPENNQNFPEDVVVEVTSNEVRNDFVRAVKKKRMGSNDIGFGRKYSIYAREQLTFFGKQLFFKCLEFRKLKDWKYLWVKNGKIFLREKDGMKCFPINDVFDLENLR